MTAATLGQEQWGRESLLVFGEDPAVIAFLQGATLLAGAGLSLVLTRMLGARPWPRLWPQCGAIALFSAELWVLLLP